jgi:hypothetical protein
VQLSRLGGNLTQLLLYRLAHAHSVHDDACRAEGLRGHPRPRENHLPASLPTPAQSVPC